jgi:hypothetical protein
MVMAQELSRREETLVTW